MPYGTLLPYIFLIFVQTVVSQFKCDYRMYGRPKLDDCASTWLAMPDSRAKVPTPRLEDFRRFVEPQLLEPPFSTLRNDFGAAMEQVPKFWRYSEPIFRNSAVSLNIVRLHRDMSLRSHGYCSCKRPCD